MKLSSAISRMLLAGIAVCVLQVVAGMLVPVSVPMPPHFFAWIVATNFLVAGALSLVAMRSEWQGWRLGVAVAAVPATVFLLNMIEGVVFLPNSQIHWPRLLAYGLIANGLSVPLWPVLFGRDAPSPSTHYRPFASQSLAEKIWKLVVADGSYVFLYLVAGMIVFPFVRSYYATQRLPTMGEIVSLQLLVRGPVFVGICLLLTRMLGLPGLRGALAVGALFTVVSGVAPLLPPNPYFPDSIRWAHFCEVVSENFVFGAFVAWVWGQPKK